MRTAAETGIEAISAATPLDMYRAVRAYEIAQGDDRRNVGVSAELFDGSEYYGEVQRFAESSSTHRSRISLLGTMSIADGINVDGLARLYLRRGKEVADADHEIVVELLMSGGYLAVAVNRIAFEGIATEYSRQREHWWEEDAALQRAIGRAGLTQDVYARNNIRQPKAGIRGPSYLAATVARLDWSGRREGGTPGKALQIGGLST